MNTVTKHWFPPTERSRANGIFIGGMPVAPAPPLLLVKIVEPWGWHHVIFRGAGGMLLSLTADMVVRLLTPLAGSNCCRR